VSGLLIWTIRRLMRNDIRSEFVSGPSTSA
jgi:hypothetical protein